jgi:hypothetical protein
MLYCKSVIIHSRAKSVDGLTFAKILPKQAKRWEKPVRRLGVDAIQPKSKCNADSSALEVTA